MTVPTKPKSARATAMEDVASRRRSLAKRRATVAIESALEKSATAIEKAAPQVIARLVCAALDPADSLHEKAVLMLGERLLPVRGFAASAIAMTGSGQGGNSTPSISITVVAANGPKPIDGSVTVKALDAPALPDEADGENSDD